MEIEEIINKLISWAKKESIIEKVYLYGSKAKGRKDNIDLDIALVITDENVSNALSLYIENRARWDSELREILPNENPHIERLDESDKNETPHVKTGIMECNTLAYEKQ